MKLSKNNQKWLNWILCGSTFWNDVKPVLIFRLFPTIPHGSCHFFLFVFLYTEQTFVYSINLSLSVPSIEKYYIHIVIPMTFSYTQTSRGIKSLSFLKRNLLHHDVISPWMTSLSHSHFHKAHESGRRWRVKLSMIPSISLITKAIKSLKIWISRIKKAQKALLFVILCFPPATYALNVFFFFLFTWTGAEFC